MRAAGVVPFLLLLTLLPPSASAAHADDAGTGTDAPETPTGALPIALGSIFGGLHADEGDDEDWYALALPAGHAARLTLAGANGWIEARSLEGVSQGQGSTDPFSDAVVVAGSRHPTLLVRVWTYATDPVPYSLLAEDMGPAPDLAVERLVVRPQRSSLNPGAEMFRHIDVDVANHGGVAGAARLRLLAEHDVGLRVIRDITITLAPGEARSYTFEWERTGEIGNATVRATLLLEGDQDMADNRREARDAVLVGAVDGADLLNGSFSTGVYSVMGVSAWSSHTAGFHTYGASAAVAVVWIRYDGYNGDGDLSYGGGMGAGAGDVYYLVEEALRR